MGPIDNQAALEAAHNELVRLLDAGDAAGALEFAEALQSEPEFYAEQLRAIAYTGGGQILARRDLLERGVELWRSLLPQEPGRVAYNLANAEQGIWELAVREKDIALAWEQDRQHLREARQAYLRIARDSAQPVDVRAQAFTNAGNSYDMLGRDLDALACYDDATGLDASFAMAHGNRGVALLHVAPFMGEHRGGVFRQAAAALDKALFRQDSVFRVGGPAALAHFKSERASIRISEAEARIEDSRQEGLGDAYLDWCLRNRLFLHVSHDCIRNDTRDLDAVYFRGIRAGASEHDQARVEDLAEAFNAVKQAYTTTRYLTWLATDPTSPIWGHTRAVSRRIYYTDPLSYGRYGTRTGIAIQALAGAVDVLDKIAGFVHLYLRTGRRRDVYFSSIARNRRRDSHLTPEIAAAIVKPERNRGLLALCDLSEDLNDDTLLRRLTNLRHTATHRFLVVHSMMPGDSNAWLDHLGWDELVVGLHQQLAIARGAVVYLARAIDIHENLDRKSAAEGGFTVTLPLERADTDLEEWDSTDA